MEYSDILPPDDPNRHKPRNCSLCNQPLGEFEISLGWKNHQSGPCRNCYICGQECSTYHIGRSLAAKRQISHDACFEKKMAEELAARPVEITQGHLDYLNKLRLEFAAMVLPDLEKSEEENMETAFDTATKGVADLSIEEMFIYMRKLEAAMAAVSIVLAKTKSRKEITVGPAKTKKAKAAPAEEVSSSTVPKQRTSKSPEEKAIAQLMKIGLTREMAEAEIQKAKKL